MRKKEKKIRQVDAQGTVGLGDNGLQKKVKAKKSNRFVEKSKDKLRMYDGMLENIVAKDAILEPDVDLTTQQIHIGFSTVSSSTRIFKYFLISQYGDWVPANLFTDIRNYVSVGRVRVDFTQYIVPHKIDWTSPEMKNRMRVWEDFTSVESDTSVFGYRENKSEQLRKERIVTSTDFLNKSDLEYERKFAKMFVLVTVSGERTETGLVDMEDTIKLLYEYGDIKKLKFRELKVNLVDYLKYLTPMSLGYNQVLSKRTSKKIVTDDILAHLGSFKQGVVGTTGVSMGVDILARVPVLRKFKEDPDKAEVMLICAETGGGKSYFVKTLITQLLADNVYMTILDYEGDEYTNLYKYIGAANSKDAVLISFGKGGSEYFDPMRFPALVGDPDIDDELKENSINFTLAMFNIIVAGSDSVMTDVQRKIVSEAISRVFDSVGLTDDKTTWHKSVQYGLTITDVYEEIKLMVMRKEFTALDDDGVKHKAAMTVQENASIYFEAGEARYGSFAKPLAADAIYNAKLTIFSFGAKGQAASTQDRDIIALRQLGVAYICTAKSNYCKSVLKTYHGIVYEEVQRWGDIKGSDEILSNSITGGRKRGEMVFLITNDMSSILDDSSKLNARLRQNIQNYAIGKIRDKGVREKFCEAFEMQDCRGVLHSIATGVGDNVGFNYNKAFCIMMDNGKRAVVKVMLPPAIARSKLFKTGVEVDEDKK